jgi:LAO/AO transport system kinase
MWQRIDAGLRQAFREDARVRADLPGLSARVAKGDLAASVAARELLAHFLGPEGQSA